MKLELISASLNASAALTGVMAAFFWFKASRKVSFDEALSMLIKPDDLMDVYWKLRQVDADARISADWNRIAALWTAVSAFLAGAASMISALAG